MAAIKIKNDGWSNLFTGMGNLNTDPRQHTTVSAKNFLTEQELIDLYVDNGFAKKIVDRYVKDMLRERFVIEGDEDNLVISKIDEIYGWRELEKLLKWNRLFGGAVCVMRIDDGQDLDKPINLNNIRTLELLRTYDRYRVTWSTTDLYDDPKNKNYGNVQYYWISPIGSTRFRVHESRCLVLDGIDIPDYAKSLNQGWGASFVQHCFEQLRDLGSLYPAIGTIVDNFVTGVMTMQNLTEMIAAGKEGVVKQRLHLMDMSKHILNTMLLDERETYEKKSSTVTGLADLIEKFLQALSAVSGMPIRILMGQQQGGLNNQGEGETRDWYDSIAADQTLILSPVLERLVKIIMLSKNDGFKGAEIEDWFIEFNPLWQMSEKEGAEIRKLNAESDNLYIQNSTLLPQEVAISRFGGAKYGKEITLEGDHNAITEKALVEKEEQTVNITDKKQKLGGNK